MQKILAQFTLSILVFGLAAPARLFAQAGVVNTNWPTVNITATDASATEGADSGAFTVTREGGDTNGELKVALGIDGTAKNGIDYVAISNWVVIAAGMRSARIEILPIDDTLVESNETVVVRLLNTTTSSNTISPYRVGSLAQAYVLIHDNDVAPPHETNRPPVVTISSPTNYASFSAPANIMIFADPSDPDGIVQKVEFFAGTNRLGVATNNPGAVNVMNPWNVSWLNVPAGQYELTAVATDDRGARGTSPVVRIYIREVNTNPPPVTVTVTATDNSATEIPVVPPGMGRPQLYDPAVFTFTRSGDKASSLTVYFSVGGTAKNGVDYESVGNSVVIPAGSSNATVTISPIDDTLVEGTESVEIGIQAPVCPAIFPPPPGCYQLGVPSHAVAYIHDDDQPTTTNRPPVVFLTSPANNAVYLAPANILLSAAASDPDGSVASVAFYAGTNRIGQAVFSSNTVNAAGATMAYSFVWSNVAVGNYELFAKATDNAGATSISSQVRISVVESNRPPEPTNRAPVVKLISPPNGAAYKAPATIFLQASAYDPDGLVTSVAFYSGSTQIGVTTLTPNMAGAVGNAGLVYAFAWSNVTVGNYVLTARATDNVGASGVSPEVRVSVVESNRPPEPTNTFPVVTIYASDSSGSERAATNNSVEPNTATFIVRRAGDATSSLTVFYAVSGTASNGVDYETLPGTVSIPAGEHSGKITVKPIDDSLPEPTETVVLALQPSPMASLATYNIGYPSKAAAYILDNDRLSPPTCRLPDGLFHLCKPGTNGFPYRLECSTDMTNWVVVCTNVVVKDGVHFVEPDTTNAVHRFYRILPELAAPTP